ncbi:MAG: hypothetical protein E7150_05735, partial [Bacillus sp. (in: Bacteria)]|nr:hypothetical protein [Bacillus sp. (in: firmicutes)]
KELMNRPFYWTYLEKTGGTPNPMTLTLITDQEKAPQNTKGELIHFGAPRLNQIFQTTKKFARFVRLFEDVNTNGKQTSLFPWLGLNVKISYQCDLKKDVMRSFGLNLIHGKLVEDFQTKLEEKMLTPKIPDYCFTLTPLIKLGSGVKRIEQFLRNEFAQEDHGWAIEAMNRWNQDLALLDLFYEDMDEKPDSYNIEKEALKEQYEPKIIIELINGGVFYLKDTIV